MKAIAEEIGSLQFLIQDGEGELKRAQKYLETLKRSKLPGWGTRRQSSLEKHIDFVKMELKGHEKKLQETQKGLETAKEERDFLEQYLNFRRMVS